MIVIIFWIAINPWILPLFQEPISPSLSFRRWLAGRSGRCCHLWGSSKPWPVAIAKNMPRSCCRSCRKLQKDLWMNWRLGANWNSWEDESRINWWRHWYLHIISQNMIFSMIWYLKMVSSLHFGGCRDATGSHPFPQGFPARMRWGTRSALRWHWGKCCNVHEVSCFQYFQTVRRSMDFFKKSNGELHGFHSSAYSWAFVCVCVEITPQCPSMSLVEAQQMQPWSKPWMSEVGGSKGLKWRGCLQKWGYYRDAPSNNDA